jgi:hypothetical protein
MSDKTFGDLLKDLKKAADECWDSKLATHDIAKKHASLCCKIVHELGHVPELINNRIEQRKNETGGRDSRHPDFWTSADMIIALCEHFHKEYKLLEEMDASTTRT